jgi:hypothetical protein
MSPDRPRSHRGRSTSPATVWRASRRHPSGEDQASQYPNMRRGRSLSVKNPTIQIRRRRAWRRDAARCADLLTARSTSNRPNGNVDVPRVKASDDPAATEPVDVVLWSSQLLSCGRSCRPPAAARDCPGMRSDARRRPQGRAPLGTTPRAVSATGTGHVLGSPEDIASCRSDHVPLSQRPTGEQKTKHAGCRRVPMRWAYLSLGIVAAAASWHHAGRRILA